VPNDVLVIPNVWGAEHEPDISQHIIDLPVTRDSEVRRVVVDVHRPDPKSDRHSKQTIPVTLDVSQDLSESDHSKETAFNDTRPVDLYISAKHLSHCLMKLFSES
jgi:hypothetical protein